MMESPCHRPVPELLMAGLHPAVAAWVPCSPRSQDDRLLEHTSRRGENEPQFTGELNREPEFHDRAGYLVEENIVSPCMLMQPGECLVNADALASGDDTFRLFDYDA